MFVGGVVADIAGCLPRSTLRDCESPTSEAQCTQLTAAISPRHSYTSGLFGDLLYTLYHYMHAYATTSAMFVSDALRLHDENHTAPSFLSISTHSS